MIKYCSRFCAVALLLAAGALAVSCSSEGDEDDLSSKDANVSASSGLATAAKYGGALDTVNCDGISGWVWNSVNANADINVDIYVDGKLVGTVPAKNPRPDLKKNWGFGLSIPPELKDGKPHTASAKVSGSDYTLTVWEKIQPTFTCKPN